MNVYSNCCNASPYQHIVDIDNNGLRTGRCGRCKDGAVFYTEDELMYQDYTTFMQTRLVTSLYNFMKRNYVPNCAQ